MTPGIPLDDLLSDLHAAAGSFASIWRTLGKHGVFERFRTIETFREGCALLELLGHHLDDGGIFISVISGCGLALPILSEAGSEPAGGIDPGFVEKVVRGEIVLAVAITEPGAGSDVFGLRSSLRRRGDRLFLDGRKWNITNAPVADSFVVFCRSEVHGQEVLCAVLVPRGAPGVETPAAQRLIGARDSPTGEVIFHDVPIEPGWVLGPPSGGKRLLELAFLRERLLAPWPLLGKMGRVLQEALDYVEERRQFGQPLKEFQYIQDKIVSGFELLETSRLLADQAVNALVLGRPSAVHASLAKYHAVESAIALFKLAIEIRGSYGLQEDARLGQYLADALCASVAGGTRETHKRVVFGELLLDRARARRQGRSRYFDVAATPDRSRT